MPLKKLLKKKPLRRGLMKELDEVFDAARMLCAGEGHPDTIKERQAAISKFQKEVFRLLRSK